MIKCKLAGNVALIPDTAVYFASAARACGVSEERSKILCFLIESTLELRSPDLDGVSRDVTIELNKNQNNIAVSITDKGIPYILTEKQKKILENGLVDGFNFEQLGTKGQRLTFFVGLDGISGGAPAAGAQTEEDRERLLDGKVSCRLTTPRDEDVIEVIRCIYAAWKYTYAHEDMYYLDYFKEAIGSGKYISVLAENEHRQVLGHSALQESDWFPGLPEMCSLIIKPFGRGLRLSELLQTALLGHGERLGKEGLYAMAVTTHPISQKILEKDNFTPCGINRHLAGSDKMAPGENGGRRTDMALAVRLFNKEKRHSGYLPRQCASFVKSIFDKEGVRFDDLSSDAPNAPRAAVPVVSYRRDIPNKTVDILVDSISPELAANVGRIKEPDDGANVELITVYINLKDPLCPELYAKLVEKGYVFSGCLPGSLNGDYIFLQNLKGAPMEWDKLVLAPEFQKTADRLRETEESAL